MGPNARYQKIAFALLAASPVSIFAAESVTHWASGPELTAAAFPEGSRQRAVYQSIPSTWDETIVLSASKPGSIAAFARRTGSLASSTATKMNPGGGYTAARQDL